MIKVKKHTDELKGGLLKLKNKLNGGKRKLIGGGKKRKHTLKNKSKHVRKSQKKNYINNAEKILRDYYRSKYNK